MYSYEYKNCNNLYDVMKYFIVLDNVLDNTRECASNGCQNKGKKHLQIIYLSKAGYFCDFCSEELLSLGLAIDNSQFKRRV
jgi:hypothetical protein